jgi:hypothetical protein
LVIVLISKLKFSLISNNGSSKLKKLICISSFSDLIPFKASLEWSSNFFIALCFQNYIWGIPHFCHMNSKLWALPPFTNFRTKSTVSFNPLQRHYNSDSGQNSLISFSSWCVANNVLGLAGCSCKTRSPSNWDTIIRTVPLPISSSKHKTAIRYIIQDRSCFVHFDHKCRLPSKYYRWSYSSKNLIYIPFVRFRQEQLPIWASSTIKAVWRKIADLPDILDL